MKKIEIKKIRKLMNRILIKKGLSKADAKLIVEDYIIGELEGKKSHGLAAFPSLIEKLSNIKVGKPKIKKEGKAFAFIDGNGSLGQIAAEKAREILAQKAKKEGIAMVAVRNTLTFLRPGTQAGKIAQRGLIGIVVNNGGHEVVTPPGAKQAVLATNPIGIGVPTNGEPIVADFATSKRAWGEVKMALAENRKLPPETFLNKNGNFTVDPKRAEMAVPFGDYKGFILGLLIEILTGSLVDMPMGVRNLSKEDYRVATRGCVFIAIDPRKFTDYKKFLAKNLKLVNQVRKAKRQKGVKEILIPGDRARRNREKIEKRGYFEISEKLWKELTGQEPRAKSK